MTKKIIGAFIAMLMIVGFVVFSLQAISDDEENQMDSGSGKYSAKMHLVVTSSWLKEGNA